MKCKAHPKKSKKGRVKRKGSSTICKKCEEGPPVYLTIDVKCRHSCRAFFGLVDVLKTEGVTVEKNESYGFSLTVPTSKEGAILKALKKKGLLNIHIIKPNDDDEGGLTWTLM